MASGSFYVDTSNQYIRGEVTWSSTADVVNNRSAVTVTLKFSRTNTGYTTSRTPTCYIRIGESSASYTEYACDMNGDLITITYLSHTFCGDATRNVSHNADGTGTAYIRISGSLDGSSASDYALTTTTQTVTLDTIPRASVITAFPGFEVGSGASINLAATTTSYSNTFNMDFKLVIGSTAIVDGIGGTVTGWTNISATGAAGQAISLPLTVAQQNAILALIPANTTVTATLYCRTQSGSSTIGTAQTRTATAAVHANVKPSGITIGKTGVELLSGNYVQNKSKVSVSLSATAGYGSTISGYSTTITGADTTAGSAFTSRLLSTSGTVTIETIASDTRNRTGVANTTITVQAYANPAISTFTAVRCLSNGTVDDSGTYVKAAFTAAISAVNNANAKTFKIQAKLKTASTWEDIWTYTAGYTVAETARVVQITGGFSTDYSYDVQGVVIDSYSTSSLGVTVMTQFVIMDFHQDGLHMAVGKVATGSYLLEVNGQIGALAAQGTAPLAVTSTTKVPNLNADKLDDLEATDLIRKAGGASYPFTGMPYVGTAPIVESGSNANGNYVKFADGTMICWGAPDTLTATTATGSCYISTTGVVWTFPIAFYAAPTVGASLSSSTSWITYNGLATDSVTLYRMCSVSAATAVTVRAWAMGRWKA